MKRPYHALVCGLIISLMPVSPIHAGEDMTGSEQSAVSTTVLVSLPVFLVLGSAAVAVEPSIEAVDDSLAEPDTKTKSRVTAKPPATMKVVEVTRTTEGNRQVVLQATDIDADAGDPQAGNYRATLTWPMLEIDPASGYKPGETVHFVATTSGSGWLIRNAEQQIIGFLPNAAIQTQAFSERWQ